MAILLLTVTEKRSTKPHSFGDFVMYYNSVMVGSSGKRLWKGLWHVPNGMGENYDLLLFVYGNPIDSTLQHIMHVTCLVLLYDSACKEYLVSLFVFNNC